MQGSMNNPVGNLNRGGASVCCGSGKQQDFLAADQDKLRTNIALHHPRAKTPLNNAEDHS